MYEEFAFPPLPQSVTDKTSVHYSVDVGKTEEQKAQARANIGAGTYSKPANGIPSSDMTSEVQTSLSKADTALQEHQSLAGYATQTWVQQQQYITESEIPVQDVTVNGVSKVEQKIAKIIYETGLGVDSSNAATVTAIRAFVNSSINALAAYYITADISGNAFATKSALDAGPWYYAGTVRTPTRNDYAIVVADETHEGKTARYAYTENQWAFQYTFNMSFTQAQIDAINSGITAAKIALYEAHIASTNNPHSVSKSQVGLGNVGNFKAVSTEASQGLTDNEKGNARANIGAMADNILTVVNGELCVSYQTI